MELYPLLVQLESEVVEEAATVLRRSHVTHYEVVGSTLTHRRLEDLYGVVAEAVRSSDLATIGRYAESLARARWEEGFGIAEVQDAFNALEQALWQRLVVALPPQDLPGALATLSSVLGFGKDSLCRSYVALATQRRVPSLDVGALVAGAGS